MRNLSLAEMIIDDIINEYTYLCWSPQNIYIKMPLRCSGLRREGVLFRTYILVNTFLTSDPTELSAYRKRFFFFVLIKNIFIHFCKPGFERSRAVLKVPINCIWCYHHKSVSLNGHLQILYLYFGIIPKIYTYHYMIYNAPIQVF